jgi:hypothetical protein
MILWNAHSIADFLLHLLTAALGISRTFSDVREMSVIEGEPDLIYSL